MKQHLSKLQPGSALQQILRLVASTGLAVALLSLVRLELTVLAVLLVAASKWQLALGGPKLWLHNIRDNAVDLLFLASIIVLLVLYNNGDSSLQLGVIGLFLGWQMLIKPMTGVVGHSLQSLVVLVVTLSVIFIFKADIGVAGMMVLSAVVALATADHALISMGDNIKLRRFLTAVWTVIVVQAVWLFGHWLVFYIFLDGRILVPQAAVVLAVLAYGFGYMYYDYYQRRLSRQRLYLYVGLIMLIVGILVWTSEWVSRL